MSGGGWISDAWDRADAPAARLPRVEDLPVAEQGYDRDAVREAFDAFYRHAAQLDATLRVLESVEAFGKQARDLRADIRALRVASWAPMPAPRPLSSPGYGTASRGVETVIPDALPRLAVEAAFIVLVAVGAAFAELNVGLIVLLVAAAWVIVGVAEFLASGRRATLRPGLLPGAARSEASEPGAAAAVVADAALEEPAPAPPSDETMVEQMPEAAEPVSPAEPAAEPEPVVEVVGAAEAAEAEPAPAPRRFWRRRAREPEPAPPFEPRHVRVLPAAEKDESPLPRDRWEEDADFPVSAAVAPDAHREPAEPSGAHGPAAGRETAAVEPEPATGEAEPAQQEPQSDEPRPPDVVTSQAPAEDVASDESFEPVGPRERELPEQHESEPADAWERPGPEPLADSVAEPLELEEPPLVAEAAPELLEPEGEPGPLEPDREPEPLELEREPAPAAGVAEPTPEEGPDAGPDVPPEPAPARGGRRFWRRRVEEAREHEPVPELSTAPERGSVSAPEPEPQSEPEPEPEGVMPVAEESEAVSVAPLGAAEPRDEDAARPAPAEPEGERDAPAMEQRARRHFWQRHRRDREADEEPDVTARSQAQQVERIEVEPSLDPSRVTIPWEAQAPFAAEPKPADTWMQAPEYAGVELDETLDEPAAESAPVAAEESKVAEDEGEPAEPEQPPLADVAPRPERSEPRWRRGRR